MSHDTELVARVEPHEDGGWTVTIWEHDIKTGVCGDHAYLERVFGIARDSLKADVGSERQARRAARKLLNRARHAAEFPRTGYVIR